MAKSRFSVIVLLSCLLLLLVGCHRGVTALGGRSPVQIAVSDNGNGTCSPDQRHPTVNRNLNYVLWVPHGGGAKNFIIHFRTPADNPPGPGSPLQGGANDFTVPSGRYTIDPRAKSMEYLYDILDAPNHVCDPFSDPGVIVKP